MAQQLAQPRDHAPHAARVALDERRDGVERVEEEVRVELRAQRVEPRLGELVRELDRLLTPRAEAQRVGARDADGDDAEGEDERVEEPEPEAQTVGRVPRVRPARGGGGVNVSRSSRPMRPSSIADAMVTRTMMSTRIHRSRCERLFSKSTLPTSAKRIGVMIVQHSASIAAMMIPAVHRGRGTTLVEDAIGEREQAVADPERRDRRDLARARHQPDVDRLTIWLGDLMRPGGFHDRTLGRAGDGRNEPRCRS